MTEFEWTRLVKSSSTDSAHQSFTYGYALTTGADGSIYIAGQTISDLDGQRNSGGWDAFISKYNADGTKNWTRLLGSSHSAVARALTTI